MFVSMFILLYLLDLEGAGLDGPAGWDFRWYGKKMDRLDKQRWIRDGKLAGEGPVCIIY